MLRHKKLQTINMQCTIKDITNITTSDRAVRQKGSVTLFKSIIDFLLLSVDRV